HRALVIRKGAHNELPPAFGEVHDAGAAVAGVISTLDECFSLQAIYRGGGGAAGKLGEAADLVYGQWSLVQQRLQYSKIRQSQPQRFDVAFGMQAQGLVGLPKNQPEADAIRIHDRNLPFCCGSGTLRW